MDFYTTAHSGVAPRERGEQSGEILIFSNREFILLLIQLNIIGVLLNSFDFLILTMDA